MALQNAADAPTPSSGATIAIALFASALGGEVLNSKSVLAPGPKCSPRDRSLLFTLDETKPDGFSVSNGLRRYNWRHYRRHVCLKLDEHNLWPAQLSRPQRSDDGNDPPARPSTAKTYRGSPQYQALLRERLPPICLECVWQYLDTGRWSWCPDHGCRHNAESGWGAIPEFYRVYCPIPSADKGSNLDKSLMLSRWNGGFVVEMSRCRRAMACSWDGRAHDDCTHLIKKTFDRNNNEIAEADLAGNGKRVKNGSRSATYERGPFSPTYVKVSGGEVLNRLKKAFMDDAVEEIQRCIHGYLPGRRLRDRDKLLEIIARKGDLWKERIPDASLVLDYISGTKVPPQIWARTRGTPDDPRDHDPVQALVDQVLDGDPSDWLGGPVLPDNPDDEWDRDQRVRPKGGSDNPSHAFVRNRVPGDFYAFGFDVRGIPGHHRATWNPLDDPDANIGLDDAATALIADEEKKGPRKKKVSDETILKRALGRLISAIRHDGRVLAKLCVQREQLAKLRHQRGLSPDLVSDRNRDERNQQALGWIFTPEGDLVLERARRITWDWLKSGKPQREFARERCMHNTALRRLVDKYCNKAAGRLSSAAIPLSVGVNGRPRQSPWRPALAPDLRRDDLQGWMVRGVAEIAQITGRKHNSARRLAERPGAPIALVNGEPISIRKLLETSRFKSRSNRILLPARRSCQSAPVGKEETEKHANELS